MEDEAKYVTFQAGGPSSKDATVISMGINKPLVKRVLIDMWSSVNVMYHDVFVKLGSTPNNQNFARGVYRGHRRNRRINTLTC